MESSEPTENHGGILLVCKQDADKWINLQSFAARAVHLGVLSWDGIMRANAVVLIRDALETEVPSKDAGPSDHPALVRKYRLSVASHWIFQCAEHLARDARASKINGTLQDLDVAVSGPSELRIPLDTPGPLCMGRLHFWARQLLKVGKEVRDKTVWKEARMASKRLREVMY